MATRKPDDNDFPGFDDDDDDDESPAGTSSATRSASRSGARGMTDATSSALQAMFARSPTAPPTTASIPKLPEVTPPDLGSIEVVVPAPEPVSEVELGAAFAALKREYATERDRADGEEVGVGDEVLVDIIGYVNGQVIPFSVRNDIWVDAVPDESLPGLFEALVGVPVGESVVVDVDLPDDYFVDSLRGAAASFAMTLSAAKEIGLPKDGDPAFLKKTGLGATLQEVMGGLRRAIEERREEDLESEAREMVIDEFAARTEVEVPNKLIDEEIRRRWLDAEGKTLAALGHELDDQEAALKAWQRDERTRVLAIRNLKLGLGLGAIAKRDGLEVNKGVVDGFLQAFADGVGLEMQAVVDVVQRDKATQRHFSDKLLHIIALEHVMANVAISFEE